VTYRCRIPEKKVSVTVTDGYDGTLKLAWGVNKPGGLGTYQVSRQLVLDNADKVRAELGKFVIAKMESQKVDPALGASVNSQSVGSALKQVARWGRHLYKSLFKPVDGRQSEAEQVQRWLAQRDLPILLNISVDTYTRIPWGLAYEADPEQIANDAKTEDLASFPGFWCLKYLISCLHHRVRDIDERRTKFRIFPVVHRSEYDKVHRSLDAQQRRPIGDLLREFGGEIDNTQDLYTKWIEAGGVDRILMFYCHANGTTVALSNKDSVSPEDLQRYLSIEDQYPGAITLTFLNGCATAVGAADRGFLEATGQGGFVGYVGTEAAIPNVYALRFGNEFLRCFLETGWPLVNVMDAMWRLHWPLSLVYGLNAYADLQLKRADVAKEWPPTALKNFSDETVGVSAI
jgi:hypothetical protein